MANFPCFCSHFAQITILVSEIMPIASFSGQFSADTFESFLISLYILRKRNHGCRQRRGCGGGPCPLKFEKDAALLRDTAKYLLARRSQYILLNLV